jgi:DNA polymerase III epsilon subunit family exonuclease
MTTNSVPAIPTSQVCTSFVVVDFETTGFDPEIDRIVQLAAVVIDFDGHILESFDTIVKPESPEQYTHGAQHIHGISPDQVMNGMPLNQALNTLWGLINRHVFTAHNAQFDLGFLHAESARIGIQHTVETHVDTLNLARRTDADRTRKHSLQALCEHYGITNEQAHEARSDAMATAQLLLRLMKDLGVNSPEQIQSLLA